MYFISDADVIDRFMIFSASFPTVLIPSVVLARTTQFSGSSYANIIGQAAEGISIVPYSSWW